MIQESDMLIEHEGYIIVKDETKYVSFIDRETIFPIPVLNKYLDKELRQDTLVLFSLFGKIENPNAKIERIIPSTPIAPSHIEAYPECKSFIKRPTAYKSNTPLSTIDFWDVTAIYKNILREFALRHRYIQPETKEDIRIYNEGITWEFISKITSKIKLNEP